MITSSRRQFLAQSAGLLALGAMGSASTSAIAAMGPNDKFDLVIKGGEVLDPSQNLKAARDIGIRFGAIEALEANIPAEKALRVLNASGKLVIDAEHLAKSFDGRPIVTDISVRIARGDRVGLVGPNGAGKTTLLNMLTGVLAPDGGTIKHGANIEMVALDQKRADLDPTQRVADVLTGGRSDWIEINGQRKHIASYLADFLFLPEQSRSPVKVLSGGERARLLLAKALAKPSNLLVLDEPTNDLDLETLDLLQELLADYPGTLLLVSHDRDFLDRVVSSVIVSEGEGRWVEYAGGYSDMIAQRGKAPGLTESGKRGDYKGSPRTMASTSADAGESGVASKPRRKMTFKEKHALKTLPEMIAKLDKEIATLSGKVADPKLYAKDAAAFNAASASLGKAQAEHAKIEEQWLELELLREELGE